MCKSGDWLCVVLGAAKIASGIAEVVAAEEVGGAVLGAVSVKSGLSNFAESDPTPSSTPYTDAGSPVCIGVDRGDGPRCAWQVHRRRRIWK